MSFDYKRAKRVEEALVNELGLFLAPPQRLAELKLEVRKFLVMLDAALETAGKPQDEVKGQILGRRTGR